MSEWQPIETAPKETFVLVANPNRGPNVMIAGTFEGWGWRWQDLTPVGENDLPTIWTHIPELPKATQDERGDHVG